MAPAVVTTIAVCTDSDNFDSLSPLNETEVAKVRIGCDCRVGDGVRINEGRGVGGRVVGMDVGEHGDGSPVDP